MQFYDLWKKLKLILGTLSFHQDLQMLLFLLNSKVVHAYATGGHKPVTSDSLNVYAGVPARLANYLIEWCRLMESSH